MTSQDLNQDQPHPPEGPKLHRDAREKKPFDKSILTALGVFTGLMMAISLFKLIPESGPVANLKALLLASSSTLVAYGVNRFSIERGAPLAAVGYKIAGVASVVAILLTGSGMAIGAFSGMSLSAIDGRVLQINGANISTYITRVNTLSLDARRASPALQLIADDLAQYAACEAESSCVSQVGSGGYGPAAKALQKHSARANAMAVTFNQGEIERNHILKNLNDLNAAYQKVLADPSLDHEAQRVQLQPIHMKIEQLAAELEEILPVHLLTGYAQELQAGVEITGQRRTSKTVSLILKEHGDALVATLDSMQTDEVHAPSFPLRPGMLASLAYMDDFAAFAIVIIVAELCLPLMLWILAYQRLSWEIERRTPVHAPRTPAPQFDGILTLPPLVHRVLPAGGVTHQNLPQDAGKPSRDEASSEETMPSHDAEDVQVISEQKRGNINALRDDHRNQATRARVRNLARSGQPNGCTSSMRIDAEDAS